MASDMQSNKRQKIETFECLFCQDETAAGIKICHNLHCEGMSCNICFLTYTSKKPLSKQCPVCQLASDMSHKRTESLNSIDSPVDKKALLCELFTAIDGMDKYGPCVVNDILQLLEGSYRPVDADKVMELRTIIQEVDSKMMIRLLMFVVNHYINLDSGFCDVYIRIGEIIHDYDSFTKRDDQERMDSLVASMVLRHILM